MSQQQPASIKDYLDTVATHLRQREAHMRRGDLAKLDALEEITDEDLLRKWSWMSAIAGLGVCFFIVPFVLSIINRYLPSILAHLLWSIVLVSMLVVMGMFGAAIYLTVKKKPGDD